MESFINKTKGGKKTATQSMNMRKRDSVKFEDVSIEDYENGKLRDKAQTKLNEFMKKK